MRSQTFGFGLEAEVKKGIDTQVWCKAGLKKYRCYYHGAPRDLEQSVASHPRGETMVIKWFVCS